MCPKGRLGNKIDVIDTHTQTSYNVFGTQCPPGLQVTKRVKRKLGKESREARLNVHLKKVTSKDTKAKAREEEALPLLNIFVIISKGYRKFIPYKVPSNKVGKMSTKVYTQEILTAIKQDLLDHSLTL